MKASTHNITGKLFDADRWFALNLLSHNADITDEAHIRRIEAGSPESEFVEKGYVVDPEAEERIYRAAYLDFIDRRETDEIQIFYAPWYACNFACGYCYQASYESSGRLAAVDEFPVAGSAATGNEAVMGAFFSYVDKAFAGRKKYLTLFGGEPLLPGRHAKAAIDFFLEQSVARNLETAVVTNGYALVDYIPALVRARIREIQVTLDGTAAVHDARRPLKNNGRTFDRVVAGIDAALGARMPVNLRMVIDRDNMKEIRALARFAIDKGWTADPLFKTQLGRSYELHSCMNNRDRLYSRLSMYQELYAEIKAHPEILEFHKPAYSISRFLFEHGDLPDPLFDSCPGAKTEWAFDYTGKIYSCTATVGKQGEELGAFYPDVRLDETAIEAWQNRDVASIAECRACAFALACGGGCAAAAKNRTGKIESPDCRPIHGLLELGLSLYLKGGDNV